MNRRWIIRNAATNVRLSGPLTLQACIAKSSALARQGIAVRVLSPEAELERKTARRVGYRLQPGMTWQGLAERRRELGISQQRSFPLVSTRGVTAWGVPLNGPANQKAEHANRMAEVAGFRREGAHAVALMNLVWNWRARIAGGASHIFNHVDLPHALDLMDRLNRRCLRAA